MTRADLERFFVAAQDDPVLAAWAKVIHDYGVEAHFDVPPHEHWEAFQEFFSCGIISPLSYDSTNIKRVFFSGERPFSGDVQDVLDNVKLLCPEHFPEEPMKKAAAPMSAFSNESAITSRAPSGIAQAPTHSELGPRRRPTGLSPFQADQHSISHPAQPRGLQPFQQEARKPAGLQCQDVDAGLYVGGMELNGHIVCCGEKLETIEEGGDIISAEDMPDGEDYALVEYMFHAECKTCKTIYHTTAGKPVPREDF